MYKIRTIVAHHDEDVKTKIVSSIENLDYVDIVGVSCDGVDTYNKIIELKPEMVFLDYNFKTMNGFEVIKKSKEQLEKDIPIFNLIANSIPEDELKELIKITGSKKINALVRAPYNEKVKGIMKDYNEYKFKKQ